MIYKSIMKSKTEYVCQIRVASFSRNAIHLYAQRRQVGALILFHRIYHGDAPTPLNNISPPPPVDIPTCHHTPAVAIPSINTAGHKLLFLQGYLQHLERILRGNIYPQGQIIFYEQNRRLPWYPVSAPTPSVDVDSC